MLAAAVLQLFVLGVGQNAHVAQEARLANPGELEEEVSCLGSPDPDLPPKSVPRAVVLPSGSPGRLAGCAQGSAARLGLTHSAALAAKSGQPGPVGKRRSLGTTVPSNLPALQANSLALCLPG